MILYVHMYIVASVGLSSSIWMHAFTCIMLNNRILTDWIRFTFSNMKQKGAHLKSNVHGVIVFTSPFTWKRWRETVRVHGVVIQCPRWRHSLGETPKNTRKLHVHVFMYSLHVNVLMSTVKAIAPHCLHVNKYIVDTKRWHRGLWT